jgi:hypothetical protein
MIKMKHSMPTPEELVRAFCSKEILGTASGGILGGNQSDAGKTARHLVGKQRAAVNDVMAGIDAAFAGYNPAFYDNARQQYVAAGMPGLSEKYQTAREQTQYGLANRGLQQSSTSEKMGDKLANQMSLAKMNLADQGQNYANSLQQQVENYRGQVVGQLQQAVNPAQASMSFLNQAARIPTPNASGAMTQAGGEFANQYLMANLYNNNPNIAGGQTQQQAPYISGEIGGGE